jgi:hypothetical protein
MQPGGGSARAVGAGMRIRTVWGVLLLLCVLPVTTAGPAAALPSFAVTPSAGLHDQQVVTVSLTDLPPGEAVGWCQAVAGDPQPGTNCLTTGYYGTGNVGFDGTLTASFGVRRYAYAPWNGTYVDCAEAPGRCYIGWGYVRDLAQQGVVDLAFAAPPPPPTERGTLDVPPEVREGEVVTIGGEGFRAGAPIGVFLCPPGFVGSWQCRPEVPIGGQPLFADAAGAFTTTIAPLTSLFLVGLPSVDCNLVVCRIAAAELTDLPGTIVSEPILFVGPPPVIVTFPFDLWTVPEEVDGTTSVTIVRLSPPVRTPVTVAWETVPLGEPAAQPGEDFLAASGIAEFDPGSSEVAIEVQILDDGVPEPAEGFGIHFHDPVGAGLFYPDDVPISILDDDPYPKVLPGAATRTEGDEGSAELEVPVQLDRVPLEPVTVEWTTLAVGGLSLPEGTPGLDYAAGSGTVDFGVGETEATVTIPITGDGDDEPDELIVVSFRNPTNATMGGFWGLGFGGIADDD